MSASYKPLVERFDIPRPTLIEWQKRAVGDKENWRVKHLEYLRTQLIVEQESLVEIKQKAAPCPEDMFILCIYLFFYNISRYISKDELRSGLRSFALEPRNGVEYQHEFAQRIWSLRIGDDSNKRIVNYYRIFDLLERLSVAQYALLLSFALEYVKHTKKRYQIETKSFLQGKTWQELHMYDKAFSMKAIGDFFTKVGLLETK